MKNNQRVTYTVILLCYHMPIQKRQEGRYVEPRHKKQFLDTMWQVGEEIRE
ncbi:hypothetical protein AALC25_18760 [Lachnospiraceae bacterium 29-84]